MILILGFRSVKSPTTYDISFILIHFRSAMYPPSPQKKYFISIYIIYIYNIIYIYMYFSNSKWLITYTTLPSVLTQKKHPNFRNHRISKRFFCFNLSHWKPLRYHHQGFCKTWKISWDTKGQPQKGPNETF